MSRPAGLGGALRGTAGEGARYLAAGAGAFAVDFTLYAGLIRVAGVHYLVAAPFGFAAGLGIIYVLSIRWIFAARRLSDARTEFLVFAAIGVAGMAVNELIIYAGVERSALSYEAAKLVSAAVVFGFNFITRKLVLFTRY
jgi:putative flippase GtrA